MAGNEVVGGTDEVFLEQPEGGTQGEWGQPDGSTAAPGYNAVEAPTDVEVPYVEEPVAAAAAGDPEEGSGEPVDVTYAEPDADANAEPVEQAEQEQQDDTEPLAVAPEAVALAGVAGAAAVERQRRRPWARVAVIAAAAIAFTAAVAYLVRFRDVDGAQLFLQHAPGNGGGTPLPVDPSTTGGTGAQPIQTAFDATIGTFTGAKGGDKVFDGTFTQTALDLARQAGLTLSDSADAARGTVDPQSHAFVEYMRQLGITNGYADVGATAGEVLRNASHVDPGDLVSLDTAKLLPAGA